MDFAKLRSFKISTIKSCVYVQQAQTTFNSKQFSPFVSSSAKHSLLSHLKPEYHFSRAHDRYALICCEKHDDGAIVKIQTAVLFT